ncbi:MAG: DNA oxidative demethylase AlkB [Alphaproteobacteria bacterium]|nr:DNA oxidative demethylase AlkB [Alphaproteobacteria bacterium]
MSAFRGAARRDLFGDESRPAVEPMAEGAVLLRGFAAAEASRLVTAVNRIAAAAPFRHMVTPGGFTMSVAMTNCGQAGWVTDRSGYRYDPVDPASGQQWPKMPAPFRQLAARAAAAAGFGGFAPDSCLINRYVPGARLTLHQDRNERDFANPIVSVSLGLPATFLFGGAKRADRPKRWRLESGDVAVWGGPARLAFHGIDVLAEGEHGLTGRARFNLTFRRAL